MGVVFTDMVIVTRACSDTAKDEIFYGYALGVGPRVCQVLAYSFCAFRAYLLHVIASASFCDEARHGRVISSLGGDDAPYSFKVRQLGVFNVIVERARGHRVGVVAVAHATPCTFQVLGAACLCRVRVDYLKGVNAYSVIFRLCNGLSSLFSKVNQV